MELVRIDALPGDPLAAAAQFYARIAPGLMPAATDLMLVFPAADHTHNAWRVAAVQTLARAAVPYRINAVASDDPAAIASAQAFLAAAPGVTGHYLPLDDAGAGPVLFTEG